MNLLVCVWFLFIYFFYSRLPCFGQSEVTSNRGRLHTAGTLNEYPLSQHTSTHKYTEQKRKLRSSPVSVLQLLILKQWCQNIAVESSVSALTSAWSFLSPLCALKVPKCWDRCVCVCVCLSAWPPLPFPYLSPIAVCYHSLAHTSPLPPVIVSKPWSSFFFSFLPRHRDKERKSESSCLWQCRGG